MIRITLERDMPKTCNECPFANWTQGEDWVDDSHCRATGKSLRIGFNGDGFLEGQKRPRWCPWEEVK